MVHTVPSDALQAVVRLTSVGENVEISSDVDVDLDEFADLLTDEAAQRVYQLVEAGDVAFGEEVLVEFQITATNVLQPVD